jgi:hypothetical protein
VSIAASLVRGHAGSQVVLDVHLEVGIQLLGQFAVALFLIK